MPIRSNTVQFTQDFLSRLKKTHPIVVTSVIVLLILASCAAYVLIDGRQKLSENEIQFGQVKNAILAMGEQISSIQSNIKGYEKHAEQSRLNSRNRRNINGTFSEFSYGGGTVFIRWGRVTCPETTSTTLVYTGIVGASAHNHAGGGCNHLCLPLEPQFGYSLKGQQFAQQVGGSVVQGSEYRMDNIYPFKNTNNADKSLNTEDAVCSLCHVGSRSVNIMVPGWTTCPEGWTKEYMGYIMTSSFKNHRTDYICVDEAPEGKQSGENTAGGSFLYPVEVACGGVPCPKYTDGFELACVVCTR